MSGFEYLFTFAGLLFGLAIANLATGYADVWRDRSKRAIGPLTLLLGLVLTLSICRQWLSFWGARDNLDLSPVTLFAALLVAAPYVFLSQAMFPKPGDDAGTHDDYYLDHRRVLLSMLLISPLFSLVYNLATNPSFSWASFWSYYLWIMAIPALLIASRNRWLQIAGLGAMSIHLLVLIFTY